MPVPARIRLPRRYFRGRTVQHGLVLFGGQTATVVVDSDDQDGVPRAWRSSTILGGTAVVMALRHQVVHGQTQDPPASPTTVPASSAATVISTSPPGRQVLPGDAVEHSRPTSDRFPVLGANELSGRQLAESGDDGLDPTLRPRQIGDHFGTLIGRQIVDPERVQIGAHRGERGAQFVGGVGGEVLRGLKRIRGRRLEHRRGGASI